MDEIYISAKNLTKSFGSRKVVPVNKINECGYDTALLPYAAAIRRNCSGGDFSRRPSGCCPCAAPRHSLQQKRESSEQEDSLFCI